MHKNTGINKKTDETAQTMSRTTQKSARTTIDYALKAQEINAGLLRRASQAWIEGFRYQGMAQAFFGHRGSASESTTHVELLAREQSNSEVTGRLDGLSEAELKRVGKYEEDNKNRRTIRKEMN